MKYKATLGTTSIIITTFISLLLAGFVGFLIYRVIESTETAERVTALLVIIFILALYVLSYLYRPVYYIVDGRKVVIKRPLKDFEISIDRIKDIFLVKKESMQWVERVGGNAGLFGFYGKFRNGFGMMTWFATKRKNFVMIETLDKDRFVLTPDDTGMIKEIKRSMEELALNGSSA